MTRENVNVPIVSLEVHRMLQRLLELNLRICYWTRGDDPKEWKGPREKGWNDKRRDYPASGYDPERMNLGVFTGQPARTIARLLLDFERDGVPPGAVLLVDEASMVGTRDLARLGAHLARAGER